VFEVLRKTAFAKWQNRMLVAEAAILLFAASLLIRLVPLRLWRSSLGHRHPTVRASRDTAWRSVRTVIRAINRAADCSPIRMVCLPRAMVAQWMLARRGVSPQLVLGVAPPEGARTAHALHAWVEVDGRIVMGARGRPRYCAAFVIEQGLPSTQV